MHEDFKLAISTFKRKRKKIVMCHGVFDVIHSGHIEYFKQAKNLGDILVVSVTTDKFVNKGPFRPINTIKDRINVLKNLAIVDLVIQSDYETAEKNIDDVKPDIYCKGPDYIKKNNKDINLKKELNTLKKNKGKFITVKHIKKSSNKINIFFWDRGRIRFEDWLKYFNKDDTTNNPLILLASMGWADEEYEGDRSLQILELDKKLSNVLKTKQIPVNQRVRDMIILENGNDKRKTIVSILENSPSLGIITFN